MFRTRRVARAGLVVAAIAAAALAACTERAGTSDATNVRSTDGRAGERSIPPATTGGPDKDPPGGVPEGVLVRVRNGAGAAFARCLELADSEPERNVGLSDRDAAQIGDGMLFRFETTDRRPFWMLDTRVPLLLVPLGADLRIAEVIAMEPCRPEDASKGGCRLYEPSSSYAQAIEVPPASLSPTEAAAFVPGAEVEIGDACRPRV